MNQKKPPTITAADVPVHWWVDAFNTCYRGQTLDKRMTTGKEPEFRIVSLAYADGIANNYRPYAVPGRFHADKHVEAFMHVDTRTRPIEKLESVA